MIYCRKCGNQMPDDTVYCNKCGYNQNGSVGNSASPSEESFHPNDENTLYFGHSTKTITRFVLIIAFIIGIATIVTLFIDREIIELEEHYWKYGTEIKELTLLRNINIFIDVAYVAALLWRCNLTKKNYLRINNDSISGVSCLPFGFTTVDVHNIRIDSMYSVGFKDSETLIVVADKKYVFLIENAEKARNEIYWKMHKKTD